MEYNKYTFATLIANVIDFVKKSFLGVEGWFLLQTWIMMEMCYGDKTRGTVLEATNSSPLILFE